MKHTKKIGALSLAAALSLSLAVPAESTAASAEAQAQTEKGLALINTFATGDTETAASLLAEGYIQHTPAYGAGRDAFVSSVEGLAAAPVPTTVNNIRAFEDGNYVLLQTVHNFAGAGEQAAFDVFRFNESGKIAGHWNVMETIADESAWQNDNGKF